MLTLPTGFLCAYTGGGCHDHSLSGRPIGPCTAPAAPIPLNSQQQSTKVVARASRSVSPVSKRKRDADSECRYTVVHPIDQGAFGVVVKAKNNITGEIVAIKRINLHARAKLQIMRELCALRNCHHKNIVKLVDTLCSDDTMSLVLEYVPFNLKQIIYDETRPNSEEIIAFFFHQVVKALGYLHRIQIMHRVRDIKPENILVTTKNTVKLADFGQACLYYPKDKAHTYEEDVGTRFYRAPELFFGDTHYTRAVDIWSFGCVLVEMINRTAVFPGKSDFEQISRMFQLLGTPTAETWPEFTKLPDSHKIVFDPVPTISDWSTVVSCSPSLLEVVRSSLSLSPSSRLSPSSLLRLPFFSSTPSSIRYHPIKSVLPNKAARPKYTLDSIFADMSL